MLRRLCLLLSLLTCATAQQQPARRYLADLAAAAPDNVIRLNVSSFVKAVNPRAPGATGFALIIFFDSRTVRADRPQLDLKAKRKAFAEAAQQHRGSRAVFWAALEHTESSRAFAALGVTALPQAARVGPAGVWERSDYTLGGVQLYQAEPQSAPAADWSAAGLLRFAATASDDVKPPPPRQAPPEPALRLADAGVFVVALGFLLVTAGAERHALIPALEELLEEL